MDRKEIARESLMIQQQGYYERSGERISFVEDQQRSEEGSRLFTPGEGAALVAVSRRLLQPKPTQTARYTVANEAAVKAILDLDRAGLSKVGVLNFASAKNPGGGFLNGAMAQEESLAASSGLYMTLLHNEDYYKANRACPSMMYTDHAIYSPEVVFFRDERFRLMQSPVKASVLTLPAVNYGQVVLKGEDTAVAEQVMKERMRLALAIFSCMEDRHLVLGAYGCGVFRNDPVKVARWWRELLEEEGYGSLFASIHFAVLDASKEHACFRVFEHEFN